MRYPLLNFVSGFFFFLAGALMAGGFFVLVFAARETSLPVWMIIAYAVGGLIAAVSLAGLAESIRAYIDIANNTHEMVELLDQAINLWEQR